MNEDRTRNERADISILGCGWLGLPLARKLMANGHSVKASRRSDEGIRELEQEGIEAYRLLLDPEDAVLPKAFFRSPVLLIDIPPGRKDPQGAEAYPDRIRTALEKAREEACEKVLLVSSTSVHPERNGKVMESDIPSQKGNGPVLYEAEELLKEHFPGTSTIVRFGGLIGPGRHPVRFLSGRKSSKSPDAPVNMIHLRDATGILERILYGQHWGETFDACAPEHPTRKAFYENAALKAGLEAPGFDPNASNSYKEVDPGYLIQRTGYRFIYPDPLEMPVE
jgi:nucleoside-diphosphate-sugar epimerase